MIFLEGLSRLEFWDLEFRIDGIKRKMARSLLQDFFNLQFFFRRVGIVDGFVGLFILIDALD